MTPSALLALVRDARRIRQITDDPLLPSAIHLLTDAATHALAAHRKTVVFYPQQEVALQMVLKLREAYLCLYGFSPCKPPTSPA